MRKTFTTTILALILCLTGSAQLFAQAVDYTPTFTGSRSSSRGIKSISLSSPSYPNHTSNSYNTTDTEFSQCYVDKTGSVTMKVGAGETVTMSYANGAEWLHPYVYIDCDNNGFTAGIAADGYTPTGDLVSYGFYNNNGSSDENGWNSIGAALTGNSRNNPSLPSFKAPSTKGTYRMRIKLDWCNIDPRGDQDGKFNDFKANGGHIVDVMLEVAEAGEFEVTNLFQATTIENGTFAQGTVWYSLQIGANGYVIANNGNASYITLNNTKSNVTDDAQLWAFTGNDTEGYKLYNKQAGATKVLAAPTTMLGEEGGSSYPKLVDANSIPSGYTDTWMFRPSADLGDENTYFYMYEKGYPSNAVNNRDNILAFWNGGTDGGSTLNIRFAQTEHAVNANNGEWTASKGDWASAWQSGTSPYARLTESQTRNNMAYYNGTDIQLFTCLNEAKVNGVNTATYNVSTEEGYSVAGYRFDFVSSGTYNVTVTPDGGTAVTANSSTPQTVAVSGVMEATLSFTVTSSSNMFANTSNFYITIVRSADPVEESQEIFVSKAGGIPYRIPAIAMAKNGDLIAVADYRHSGSDIGVVNYGRIDLHARISKNNGESWGNKFSIVDGMGSSSPDFMHVGFGDPCIVADRESDRVLVLSCAGNVSFQQGTRNNHQNIARFYSENNGETWSEPEDIAPSIYAMWDNSSYGPAKAMFVGSGKIHQSRYVKVNDYYRLYCAVLLRDKSNNYTNFVLYSDDFGGSWDVLGGVNNAPIASGGDEPKVEELPNGNVILSSRIKGGRFFNIFTFTNAERAEGSWGSHATSDASVNGVVAKNNSTNGEILILPVVRNEDKKEMWIALQSVPFGSDRNNVGIYYKELESEADYNTPANFAKDWDGRHQSTRLPSAYSTMCLQKDSTIAFLYEENLYNAGYTIVYKNYTLEYITDGAYSIAKGEAPEVEPEGPSDATIALIAEAKELLEATGVGYPAEAPRATLQAAIDTAEENPTASNGSKLEVAMDNYIGTTDVVLPQDGKSYTITMVAKNGTRRYLNYTGSDIAIALRSDAELPASAHFLCKENGDGTVTLTTSDNRYLVYHSKYEGVNWLQGGGDTDGLQDSEDEMTKITFAKIQNGNNVDENNNEQLFGLLTWYSLRGYEKGVAKYGYMVLKTDGSNYDGSGDPYWNDDFSSAFLIEEVEIETAIKNIEIKNGNCSIYDLTGRRIEKITQAGIYIVDGKKVLVK